MTLSRLPLSLTLAAAVAFATAPQAQIVFDDFSTLNAENTAPINGFAFAGGAEGIGAGFGTVPGQDGAENSGLGLGVNPGAGGGFAGGGSLGPEAPVDISGASYMTFYFNPNTVGASNTPLTLEVNLQEDPAGDGFDPNVDDEYQAVYRVEPGAGWQLVAIPLAAFTDDNTAGAGSDDGFDFSKLATVVFAFGGLQGDEFNVQFDDILFWDNLDAVAFTTEIVFDDFSTLNAENTAPINGFAFAGGAEGIGAGFGTVPGQDGAENSGLGLGVNPGAGGGFAGGGSLGPEAPVDISGASYMTFYFNPNTVGASNTPLTLEVNLQEDPAGDGFDPNVDDEYQAVYRVEPGAGWQLVAIPLAAFTDDNTAGAGSDDGFDFSKLATVVFAFGGLQGDEFNVQFDDIAFVSNVRVATSGESLPEVFNLAPLAFPNPTAGASNVEFGLTEATDIAVSVYDLLGRRVATVFEGPHSAGLVRLGVPVDQLSAGVYLVLVQTTEGVASTRLTVVR